MIYRNPLAYGSDPFAMLADDGYYYVLCSGWEFYRTKDLIHYESLGQAYTPTEDDWFLGAASAPELYHFGDKYYIFHTTESKINPTNELENRQIGVLVSNRPEGPYKDLLGRPIFDPGYCAIDIHVYHEDDKFYLYWCWSCYHHPVGKDDLEESWIFGAELKPDFTDIIGHPKLMVHPCQEWENHTVPLHQRRWNEGPFVLKHNGVYYMTFSANTFEDYGVGYATAPTPLGPWTKAPENPILYPMPERNIYAPGHNSFIHSKDGSELFMVYHMITDEPFFDPNAHGKTAEEMEAVLALRGQALGDFPDDKLGRQHWPGYAKEFIANVPCKDWGRKIAINRVHFTDDGKLVLDGPTIADEEYPSGNE